VPLTTFDDYLLEVEKMGRGERAILTTSRLRLFELSSGSTTASKMIPYTDLLQAEFQAGIAPWIFSLFRENPDIKRGTAYWSISPLTQGKQHTAGGIPVGFEDDSAYLGHVGNLLAKSIMAVPNEVKFLEDIDTFRYVTLFFLLKSKNLRLISVWNPTFFSLMLAPLKDWWSSLLGDITVGQFQPPGEIWPEVQVSLKKYLSPDPDRASELSRLSPEDYARIWPGLQLISCWMDGPSEKFSKELREMFPRVTFQGKGLIATEAFVSFPLPGLAGSALSVNSHFFEFLPADGNERPLLAHELERGQLYSVIVTTGGGLYRYRLQDMVEICGYFQQAPVLRFLYKTDRISSWFGEKLTEGFVAQKLSAIFEHHQLAPKFYLLAPDNRDKSFCYTLFLELEPEKHQAIQKKKITNALDDALRQNYHYDYCRRLGQIREPSLFLISGDGSWRYLQERQERGQKLGDIKSSVIENTTGWHKVFKD